jgi:hypothetical protein
VPKPIVIRFSLGDAHFLWETARCAVEHRSWDVVRKSLWVMRENRRQGTWEPWTIGDFIIRRRMRQWGASTGGERPFWRHGP